VAWLSAPGETVGPASMRKGGGGNPWLCVKPAEISPSAAGLRPADSRGRLSPQVKLLDGGRTLIDFQERFSRSVMRHRSQTMSHPILLYDGVCGLCNRLVQFILRRDPAGVFRFVSLQSAVAGRLLERHGVEGSELDTVYVVVDAELPEERLLGRSDAVIFILRQLGRADHRSAGQARAAVPTQATATPTPTTGASVWSVAAVLLSLIPRVIRDWGYGMIARNRYRMFGRYDTCPMPSEETRDRFLG
jgi:predicted DCC family thiol-disulfide oxidoreductase YuxK